jgi:hypothetical protein
VPAITSSANIPRCSVIMCQPLHNYLPLKQQEISADPWNMSASTDNINDPYLGPSLVQAHPVVFVPR